MTPELSKKLRTVSFLLIVFVVLMHTGTSPEPGKSPEGNPTGATIVLYLAKDFLQRGIAPRCRFDVLRDLGLFVFLESPPDVAAVCDEVLTPLPEPLGSLSGMAGRHNSSLQHPRVPPAYVGFSSRRAPS